jgi:ubiquinone/menaquinone biosynthesis C-methylase UbiE
MHRRPEPELMDLPEEAAAYAQADFADVNQAFVDRLCELCPSLASEATHESTPSLGSGASPDPRGAPSGVRVLDLGTGPGDIPIRLIRRRFAPQRISELPPPAANLPPLTHPGSMGLRPVWTITAIDASAAMLRLARAAVRQAGMDATIFLVRADAKRLPFADGSFDVIMSNSILHHVADVDAFWSETRRVGRPGAFLFLRDLARPSSDAAARAIVDQYAGGESALLREEFHRSLLSAYTPAEVRAQLERAGLPALQVAISSDRHLDAWGMTGAAFSPT